jgi:hypothetical protein
VVVCSFASLFETQPATIIYANEALCRLSEYSWVRACATHRERRVTRHTRRRIDWGWRLFVRALASVDSVDRGAHQHGGRHAREPQAATEALSHRTVLSALTCVRTEGVRERLV